MTAGKASEHEMLALLGALAVAPAAEPAAPASWWQRRRLEHELDDELRGLGLRVALSEGGAVLLDEALREQAAQVRRVWHELHPGAPAASPQPITELLASINEMRRGLESVVRLLERRPPQSARPALLAVRRRGERRAVRRR
jgi:hypothetical protein